MSYNKFFGVLVRILCKLYELVLIIWTRLRRGFESDPSKILVDLYTDAQLSAQDQIDAALAKPISPVGTLLVLIPFRDRWDLTATCLKHLNLQIFSDSLRVKTILIDNNSTAAETALGIEAAIRDYPKLDIESIRADYSFNFSRLNNDGYRQFKSCGAKWVLFLNNDVELRDHAITKQMVSCLESIPDAGVIGCSLLYPDQKIQHLFAAPGVKIIAAHPLKGACYNPNLEWFAKSARPVAAVTGAVMMVRSDDFERVEMFDEDLPTLGQDIALCLAMQSKLRQYSVVLNTRNVLHYESLTKAPAFPRGEVEYMYKKYRDGIYSDDYLSNRLSRWSEKPLLTLFSEFPYPAKYVIRAWG